MKNSIFIFCVLWVFSALCGVSCKRTENHLILTFDDANVDEWFAQREMFDKYNIRVTFFVTRPHQLSEEQIEKLRILQTEGHEVGCHGLNHIQATEENQYQYIETEIKPALKILSELGFTVTSFAYPFGASTPCLDSMLTHYFSFIRKATYNYRDTLISSYPEIYIEKKDLCKTYIITSAMGIDINYKISMDNLDDALVKAKKTNTFLTLYAHVIDDSNGDYTISPQYLEDLFKKMKKHKIGYATCREVVGK